MNSKAEDVVNEGDDDIGEVSSTWADETEGAGPGDDKLGEVPVDTSVIKFDTVLNRYLNILTDRLSLIM